MGTTPTLTTRRAAPLPMGTIPTLAVVTHAFFLVERFAHLGNVVAIYAY